MGMPGAIDEVSTSPVVRFSALVQVRNGTDVAMDEPSNQRLLLDGNGFRQWGET